eukprot:4255936-Amphidinium_carterae.1
MACFGLNRLEACGNWFHVTHCPQLLSQGEVKGGTASMRLQLELLSQEVWVGTNCNKRTATRYDP